MYMRHNQLPNLLFGTYYHEVNICEVILSMETKVNNQFCLNVLPNQLRTRVIESYLCIKSVVIKNLVLMIC